ncbi:polysaccharide deacetylase family protein [Desnuesiella massiliensis]|uniref:polysaccharide deacetylase family protein n=1 Tax=Desnuesiella massiliensis TaxID=1650662 RepID=UPI0006E43DCE|nr:polysaccharide deacetylase family protein [Desnuesiella massiliensis]
MVLRKRKIKLAIVYIILYMLGFSSYFFFSSLQAPSAEVVEEDYMEMYRVLYSSKEKAEEDFDIEIMEIMRRGYRGNREGISENSKEVYSQKHVLAIESERAYIKDGKKTVFLTFDDGPSANITPQILNILDKYNIKATFFVVGAMVEENKEILKRTYNSGHAIANHSYSHNYSKIYSNVDNFIYEVDKTDEALKKILGYNFNTRVFRFPGGSYGNKKEFKEAINNKGMIYIDWNSLNGDAEGQGLSKDRLINRFLETSSNYEKLVVLMHDAPGKQSTVDSLPSIIENLKQRGFEFAILK